MCIDSHQTGSVGEGSDPLQLIKFWPSCAPGKGVCGGAKFFGSALLQPARSVCVSLSAFSLLLFFSWAQFGTESIQAQKQLHNFVTERVEALNARTRGRAAVAC